jgi:hypothetical protein
VDFIVKGSPLNSECKFIPLEITTGLLLSDPLSSMFEVPYDTVNPYFNVTDFPEDGDILELVVSLVIVFV